MDAHSQFVAAHLRFGDRVAVEQPCFPPLLDLLEMAGVDSLPVAYDAEGPVAADVVAARWTPGAKVLFFQPWGQNPTGRSLTPARAQALAAVLAGRDVVVVEDDSAGGIATDRALCLGAWSRRRRCWCAATPRRTVRTCGSPAERAGRGLVDPTRERRYLGQGWSSRLLQSILVDLLTDDDAVARVDAGRGGVRPPARGRRRRARRARHRRRGHRRPQHLGAGAGRDGGDLRLASQGIGVTPGHPFAVLPGGGGHIRVTTGLVRRTTRRSRHPGRRGQHRGWGERAR